MKSIHFIPVLLIVGFTVGRPSSDFRRLGNATTYGDDGTDFTADNEIILAKHVDISEPVHGSHDQLGEHGSRSRRASDGGNGNLAGGAISKTEVDPATEATPATPATPATTATPAIEAADAKKEITTSTPTTPANDISNDSVFESYFIDFLKKNPDVQVLRSPQHFDNQNKTWTLSVKDGRDVEVLVHLLDINPFSNYLSIKAAHTDNSTGLLIAGPISPKNVQKIRVMDTQEIVVSYQFANSQSSKYNGFVLTYKSLAGATGIGNETSNSNVTIPLHEYPSIKILLEVPRAKQNNETLAQLRLLFAQSTNQFIEAEKLPIEQCKLENVKFVEVLHCPLSWPNSQSCIQIELAIPLKTIANASASTAKVNSSALASAEDIDSEKIEYELTFQHLFQMWTLHGRSHFARNEFNEFTPPNFRNLLILWTSISSCVLIAFLLVLYCIWKIDFLKDYRRMHWKMSDDQSQMVKQLEIDISMFPSPHQAVPTLFPNDLSTYASAQNASTSLPYEFVNQPISFSQSDFKRRASLEESMKLDNDAIEKHEAGVVPFQSEIIDFNEPHADDDDDEDEITFSRAAADSPRGQLKFRMNANNDSTS